MSRVPIGPKGHPAIKRVYARKFFQRFACPIEWQKDRELFDFYWFYPPCPQLSNACSMSLLALGANVLNAVKKNSTGVQAEAYLTRSESRTQEWSEGQPENLAIAKGQG